ncbi:MAG: WecB/TagA/CpsF family glycosyltransferase [Phycisphaerae bacterium]|nr:WecB/TagA/CpsF family glycosyltransferase [Phycisphaerae bacterium]
MTAATCQPIPVRELFGVPIHALTMGQVLAAVDQAIRRREQLRIGVVNVAKLVNMGRDPELAESVLTSDLVVADGMGVVWASRILRASLPERVPGIDLMMRMLEQGAGRGYRVYCLGATPEVVSTVVERIGQQFPGVVVAGSHHGYFKDEEEARVASEIRSASADILFVAMTSPKKERFLARWGDEMNVPVCHGVGGSFDVLAGKVKRAPALWQRLGLEWLYRVVQEPRRMWRRYLVTNTVFGWMVLRALLGPRRSGKPGEGQGGE